MIPERARERIEHQPIGRPLVLVCDLGLGLVVCRRETDDRVSWAYWRDLPTALADAHHLAAEQNP